MVLSRKEHKINKLSNSNCGFTVVELVVAMAVFAIAIVGILSVIIHTITQNQIDRDYDLAKQALSSKMAEIKQHNFDDIVVDYAGKTFPVAELQNSNGVITIDSSNPNLLDVQITLTWQSIKTSRTYSISKMITRR